MKVTNKLNLPKELVSAVTTEKHNEAGSYSATTLIRGVKEILLTDRHWDEIEVDASDSIFALFGSACHSLLEKQEGEGFKEESFETMVDGIKITGKIDLYDMINGIVEDYKTASIWKVIYQSFDDYKKQGLIYLWLLKSEKLPAKKMKFYSLLKDYSKSKARFDANYPKSPVHVYEYIPSDSDLKEIDDFIRSKVAMLKKYINVADDDIPPCTAEERWASDNKYAVMKEGRKSAVKVCDSKQEAEKYIKENNLDARHSIQERLGESKKCLDYCNCCEFCNFYKNNVIGVTNE